MTSKGRAIVCFLTCAAVLQTFVCVVDSQGCSDVSDTMLQYADGQQAHVREKRNVADTTTSPTTTTDTSTTDTTTTDTTTTSPTTTTDTSTTDTTTADITTTSPTTTTDTSTTDTTMADITTTSPTTTTDTSTTDTTMADITTTSPTTNTDTSTTDTTTTDTTTASPTTTTDTTTTDTTTTDTTTTSPTTTTDTTTMPTTTTDTTMTFPTTTTDTSTIDTTTTSPTTITDTSTTDTTTADITMTSPTTTTDTTTTDITTTSPTPTTDTSTTDTTTTDTTMTSPTTITDTSTTDTTTTDITTTSPTTTTDTSTTDTTTTSPTTTTDTSTTDTTTTSPTTIINTSTTVTSTTVTSTTDTTTTSATTTTVIAPMPTYTTITSATPTTTTPTTTTKAIYILGFSLKIDKRYDFSLTESERKELTTLLEKLINAAFRRLPDYLSTKVTGFRPGSLIVDFEITATSDTLGLEIYNNTLVMKKVIVELASQLTAAGLNVSTSSISRSVQGGLLPSDTVYPEHKLYLTCDILEKGPITWSKNGNTLNISTSTQGFTVTSATPEDSGEYACTSTWYSLPYVIWQRITVLPYPNLQTSEDKVVHCENVTVTVQCCVQENYRVFSRNQEPRKLVEEVVDGIKIERLVFYQPASSTISEDHFRSLTDPQTVCISVKHIIDNVSCLIGETQVQTTCYAMLPRWGDASVYLESSYSEDKTITFNATNKAFDCSDSRFGAGNEGEQRRGDCDADEVGYQVARCNSGSWDEIENACILRVILTMHDKSLALTAFGLPEFVEILRNISETHALKIMRSSRTIRMTVEILKRIAKVAQSVLINEGIMMDFLRTVDIIGSAGAKRVWATLNRNVSTENASSELLRSVEDFGLQISNKSFENATRSIAIKRTSNTSSLSDTFGEKQSTQIYIPQMSGQATIMVFSELDNILPVRNQTYNGNSGNDTKINGDVVVVQTNFKVNSLLLTYVVINETFEKPQCVFWNFNLLNGIGGWDSTGCKPKLIAKQTQRITCECNHTTSFSILMSPKGIDDPCLSYITYIGVGISLISLVLCLIIEIIVWKAVTKNKTSHVRHVSIVNIALSLLIANIWFIIGEAVNKEHIKLCTATTFFIHFFYLALFFWMLLSALFLLYCTIVIVIGMSRAKMMAIAFSIGYGAPLLITVITVVLTRKRGYYERHSCWLNWTNTKALLAFVIPALTIVAINLLVLIVVLCKMLRRGVNLTIIQPQEKHVLLVITKFVGVLTPLFGLTWGFGIGTMVSEEFWIHVVFAFLNSLQGFFVLVFGLLLDAKVRKALAQRLALENFSSSHTTK